MSMTKECEICGAIFQTDRISRKYCEECGKNPTRARQRIARAVRVNKRNAGDWEKVYDCICKYCGKTFQSTYKRTFCSDDCQRGYNVENAKCCNCGKPMLDVGIRIEHQGGWHYCSHECREEARWNAAKERGHVQTCQNCGTKFIRSSGSFCSRKCYNQAVKSGWKSQNPKPVKHIASEKACCSICGHEFIRPAGTEYPYCSPECRKIAFDNSRKKRKMQKVDAELKKEDFAGAARLHIRIANESAVTSNTRPKELFFKIIR